METDSLLAEYNALREEVKTNSEITANIFTFSMTATAAILGYGFTSSLWPVFLAPLVLILPSLWYVSSQLTSTIRIAAYIKTFIEPQLQGLNWETRLHSQRSQQASSKLPEAKYTLSITGIYGSASILCMVLSFLYLDKQDRVELVIFIIAVVFILFPLLYITSYIRRVFKPDAFQKYCEFWLESTKQEIH